MSGVINPKAIILDLDGVITRTVELHIEAWKTILDEFLFENAKKSNIEFIPMDPDREYKELIDGRPRYEGLQAFLNSRNIKIPFGDPDDDSGETTVCGLGNRKNELYLNLIDSKGAYVYNDTIEAVKRWRKERKKVAVISASRNCRRVLKSIGITDLFDAVVDGNDSLINNLKGKPEPDIFLFAASKLGVTSSEAVIIEDSSAGIKAGKKGYFGFLVGISRDGNESLLYQSGADVVISSMDQLKTFQKKLPIETLLPSAIENFDEINKRISKQKLLFLIHYDGVLTPANHLANQKALKSEIQKVINRLSELYKVVIITSHNLEDIKKEKLFDNLYYAVNEGAEIKGPGGFTAHFHRSMDNWNKGKAVTSIIQSISGDNRDIFPVYIGSDSSDEHAFKEVTGWGMGILVSSKSVDSFADYQLVDTNQVLKFLHMVFELLKL